MQIRFEFGHGLIIFERVINLVEIFSFRSLSFVWMYYKFEIHVLIRHRSVQVKFEFDYGPMIFTELSLLNLEKV
jgi:hypothetical protein